MGERGPKPRPVVLELRRGAPGHRPLKEGLGLPPADLEEPSWLTWFPAVRGEQASASKRMRERARSEWRRVVRILEPQGVLTEADASALALYCVNLAHLEEALRDMAVRGHVMQGERGWQKNGSATIAGQLQGTVVRYQRAFGLTPSDRNDMVPAPRASGGDLEPGAVGG